MMDPYFILGVDRGVDDEGVRKAYLEKIRQWPPEHYPDEFQKVSEACSLIQTHKKRLAFQLFHSSAAVDLAPLGAMSGVRGRPSLDELTEWMKKLLASIRLDTRR
ncbi:MAG: DnaJ domain-containing protein [Magnetococcales bacterium]|nr:DnaJ domain-containing protein [Magnetococcales bacterium]MBF0173916.1 DnaJ domain-containing protein [Magnetococcales bacterium]